MKISMVFIAAIVALVEGQGVVTSKAIPGEVAFSEK
jgi:hypothetical protein